MMHDDITNRIIGAAIKVHTTLGPGLLESTYHACLEYECCLAGLQFEHQVRLPIVYGDTQLEGGYRIDFLVENCVVVELKAVEKILPLHVAQLLTYLRLTTRNVGLLISFNVVHLRDGIRRVVNNAIDDERRRPSQ
jgi:GxxExxY protein